MNNVVYSTVLGGISVLVVECGINLILNVVFKNTEYRKLRMRKMDCNEDGIDHEDNNSEEEAVETTSQDNRQDQLCGNTFVLTTAKTYVYTVRKQLLRMMETPQTCFHTFERDTPPSMK